MTLERKDKLIHKCSILPSSESPSGAAADVTAHKASSHMPSPPWIVATPSPGPDYALSDHLPAGLSFWHSLGGKAGGLCGF